MKRDRLEELLKSKLDRMEVRPPDDLWARLEQQLPEIRRDLAFGGTDTAGEGNALPPPQIRRPLRRKMRWAYVAASVVAVMAMVFTMRNMQEESMVAQDGTELPDAVFPKTGPESGQENIPTDVTEGGAQTGTVRSSVRTYAAAIREHATPDIIQPAVDNDLPTQDIPQTINDTDNSPRTIETPGRTDTSATVQQDARAGQVQDKTSDMRTWDGTAAMTLEEWQKSRRRTSSRISASLYAMNAAGTNNVSGNVRSRTKLYNSSLVVNDVDSYPDEDEILSTVTRTSNEMKLKHDLPLSFGASVNIGLTDRLSIETGLTYTYMRSKGETILSESASITRTQKLHYLGIPVKLKYDFVQTRVVDVYVSGGGSLEKLLSGKRTDINKVTDGDPGLNTKATEKLNVGSLQGSVGANLGAEFNIDKMFGIYVEPGVGYFFKNSNQPTSYRAENPFNFTIKAGFRIKL